MPREPGMSADTNESAGLSDTGRVSAVHSCRHLPEVSQVPARSVSAETPSPAKHPGPVTLARRLATLSVQLPRKSAEEPLRPGPPSEIGVLAALAWLVSAPVLGVARLVYSVARVLHRAASHEPSPAEKLQALRMRLETGEITDTEFQRESARIGAARKESGKEIASGQEDPPGEAT